MYEYTAPGPFTKLLAESKSDSADFNDPPRGLLVLAAGNVKFNTPGDGGVDVTHTLTGALAGTVIPAVITRLWSTGTTATLAMGY